MAQKIPFFELFTDFSPDFDLRVPLNAAMVTNMVLEPEKRTMTLDMTVRAEMNDSTRETVEQLLARNYDLKRVDIHVKSTAEAFPDMLKNAGRRVSGSGSVIMGREIAKGRVLPISELTPKAGHVVVEGKVFKFDCHETRRAGVWTMLLEMTDYEGSLFIRRSMPEREATELLGKISVGMWLRVSGRMELSYDGKDMQLNPQDIMQIDHAERTDTAEEKRVELHLHTRMSNMDALTDTAAVVKRAIKWGMPAIAITDHGVAQSFPDAWHTGEGKIKLLYGCEGYFLNNIDDRICVHGPQDGDFSTEICCFDIETTGLKVAHDAITEIGAVILKDGEIVDTFQTFVDPERRLSPEIIGLTGITDDMLRGAPKLEDALHAFLVFAGGRPLAAHNAEFDISFIRAGCKKCGIPFEPTYLDSLIFAQNLLPELGKYKLDIVADHLQLPQFNHHRASDDAVPVAQMLAKFFVMLEERGVTRLQQINDEMTKLRPLGVKRNRFPKHIILIAKNKVGLKNLYQLISASNLKYFKRVPIIPKSELVAHREGLIIGSACEAGELFRAIVDHKDWNELKRIASFYDYLEIQPLGNNRFMVRDGTVRDDEDLKDFNRTVVKLGEELGKPVCATGDVHFLDPEDEVYRHILLASKKFADANEPVPLYFRTTDEMLKEFDYLGKEKAYEVVVTNTRAIAEQVEDIELLPKGKLFPPRLENSEEDLNRMVWGKAHELYGDDLPQLIVDRLNVELGSILGKYDVVYMSAQKLVQRSLECGYLVGSRGSVGSSLVAYMAGITEVNALPPHYRCPKCRNVEFHAGEYGCGADMPDKMCPVCGTKYVKDGFDIPFETFLGYGGGKVPDIDLNFSGEYQARAHAHAVEMFGKTQVFRAGTIGTLAEKTAYGFVKKYLEERSKTVNRAEENRLVMGCTGVKRTTGQHPGGMVVVPDTFDIYDFCAIQHPADDVKGGLLTTHFEFKYLHDTLLKLDELGHDVPTFYKFFEEYSGIPIDSVPMNDEKVYSLLTSPEALGVTEEQIGSKTGTFGIPEMGTNFVRQMLLDAQPKNFSELIQISGLSHGTDVWTGNADELIRSGTCTIAEVIGCRDSIMLYLLRKGLEPKMSFDIMEAVRKGKVAKGGFKPGWEEAMREHDVPDWYIESCRKIKYMFPKAHAVAYLMAAIRLMWFKVYHPAIFYAVYFTVRGADIDYEAAVGGVRVAKQHLRDNEKIPKDERTAKDDDALVSLQLENEMLQRGCEFLPIELGRSYASKYVVEDGKVRLPFTAIRGLGDAAAVALEQATMHGQEYISVEELQQASGVAQSVFDKLRAVGALGSLPETSQVDLFSMI